MAVSLSSPTTILLGFALVAFLWLARLNRKLGETPPAVAKLAGTEWTEEKLREVYAKFEKQDHDFTKFLPPKQNRRYVVVGGSGLVGGWIVEHLILRGEDPQAIRIADLAAPRREHAVKKNILHVKTDITDKASVAQLFNQPWPSKVAKLPLTVFHVAAYIHAGHRKPETLPIYMKVNVEGTKTVLEAAKSAGCDIFIATSSASIALRPQSFLLPPWKQHPKHFVQLHDNAEPADIDGPLDQFAGCYAYSKAKAEKLVREADDKKGRFRTGTIRPGHGIYGHGDDNRNSIITDYLLRGGFTTWLTPFIIQYVSAQNVSLVHLLFENRIHSHDLGGRAYAVCDPSEPLRYRDMQRFLSMYAHPATPITWPEIPVVPLILLSYLVEFYITVRRDHLPFLPQPSRDLENLQPAIFNYSTIHVLYDDSRARRELGYHSAHGTQEGIYLVLKEWNRNVEAKLAAGKAPGKVRQDAQKVETVGKSV